MTQAGEGARSTARTLGFHLLHLIEVNLRGAGINSSVDVETLCLHRPVYDKPSNSTFGMKSVVNLVSHGECFRRVYCVEQFDGNGKLVKFNVKLTDQDKKSLGEWHLDISHGLHTHPIVNGEKSDAHIPMAGDEVTVALEIVKAIASAAS